MFFLPRIMLNVVLILFLILVSTWLLAVLLQVMQVLYYVSTNWNEISACIRTAT